MISNPANTDPTSFWIPFDKCINNQINVISAGNLIIKPNPKRAYAAFINISSENITLIFGEIKDGGINKGIVLRPGGSYEITQINLYVGKVCAISNAESTISFTECSQS